MQPEAVTSRSADTATWTRPLRPRKNCGENQSCNRRDVVIIIAVTETGRTGNASNSRNSIKRQKTNSRLRRTTTPVRPNLPRCMLLIGPNCKTYIRGHRCCHILQSCCPWRNRQPGPKFTTVSSRMAIAGRSRESRTWKTGFPPARE